MDAVDILSASIQEAFPNLAVRERNGRLFIEGTFPIADGELVLDQYQIQLELPPEYPKGFPILRVGGNRIPVNPEHHMQDSGACLFVPEEYAFEHPEGMDAVDFLNNIVLGYLVGQSNIERGGEWPKPPRGHGEAGILEFYKERLGSDDPSIVADFIELMLKVRLKGHWECPCKSGKKIRNCHQKAMETLRERIPAAVMRVSLGRFRKK